MKKAEFYTQVVTGGNYVAIKRVDVQGGTPIMVRLPFDCEPGERVKITFETIDKPEKK